MSILTFNGKIIKSGANNGRFVSKIDIIQPVPIPTIVKYGYLYNWWAASDIRNIANTGWHLPTQPELQTLINFTGGGNWVTAGNALLENNSTYWQYKAATITNSAKYNLRGSGYRLANGGFLNIRLETYVITATDDGGGKSRRLNYPGDSNMQYASFSSRPYGDGSPIRLVKDSTSLSNGQSGTYIGNDMKSVRTICIGGQEWLADNLSETKYRNKEDIPVESINGNWTTLTTGARCAYNNLESNVFI